MNPLDAPPTAALERFHVPWRLALRIFAACATGELGDAAREIAQRALAEVEAAADHRDALVAGRGQLRLLEPGPRSYPPLQLRARARTRRRWRALHAAGA